MTDALAKPNLPDDWDPDTAHVRADQIAAYDVVRRRCPVAHSQSLHWSLFRHADVVRALRDHETFSNAVSAHASIPNGMDPPLHTLYRRMIDPYFTAERIAALAPRCRAIAGDLVTRVLGGENIEMIERCAEPYALRSQCAFLDWPAELHEPLRKWTRRNHAATRSRDRRAAAAVALEFDTHIRAVLQQRRTAGAEAASDVAAQLLKERVAGRALTDEEIVSVLRNWTVGELATISACVGILTHYLAQRPPTQELLRERPDLLPAAIDEILRIHAPLIASRRITTRAVELGGRRLAPGERVTIMWASANRDEDVFGDPDEFRLDRAPEQNLLYGDGVHVCPGASLARMELRVFMEELLSRTSAISLTPEAPVRATYPASGFASLHIHVRSR